MMIIKEVLIDIMEAGEIKMKKQDLYTSDEDVGHPIKLTDRIRDKYVRFVKALPKEGGILNGTRPVDQMPKLIRDNRIPMSVAGLMKRRLETRNSDPEIIRAYMNHSFDLGDALAYNPKFSKVKIILDSEHLRNMNPKCKQVGCCGEGSLILENSEYKSLSGEEFNRGDLNEMNIGHFLSKEDVKSNPIWGVLARGDKHLLSEYADYIFVEGSKVWNNSWLGKGVDDDFAMGITTDDGYRIQFPKSKLRAWQMGSLLYDRSNLTTKDPGEEYSRFIGVASEQIEKSEII